MNSSRENQLILVVIVAAAILLLSPYLGLGFLFRDRSEPNLRTVPRSRATASKATEPSITQLRAQEAIGDDEPETGNSNGRGDKTDQERSGELAEIEKLLKR